MATVKEVTLEALDGNRIMIPLLVTEQCNFACGHCFYSCSPQSPNLFMSDEILSQVERQVQELNEFDIKPGINLIGGEPTLNLKRFDRYLRWAMGLFRAEMLSHVEMSTNGWWLKEARWVRRFMEIVGTHVMDGEYGIEDGFTCRISNDVWHDEHRPDWLLGKNKLSNVLESAWDLYDSWYSEEVFYSIRFWECAACYETWDDRPEMEDDYICPECNEEDSIEPYYEEAIPRIPPDPREDGSEWIYVERSEFNSATSSIIPTGSASAWGGNDMGARQPGSCASSHLSYRPAGQLGDICGKGSNAPFGSVADHPLLLLALAKQYVEDMKPTCTICVDTVDTWMQGDLEDAREVFQDELDTLLEDPQKIVDEAYGNLEHV